MIKRKRINTDIRKRQIIDAAGSLIFKYGSEHLTVKNIAKQVGISDAAIYRHFKSKKSILSFLLTHIEESMLRAISPENFTDKSKTLAEIEKALINSFAELESNQSLSFQVIAEIVSLGDRKLNKQAYEITVKYTKRMKDILQDGISAGVVRSDIDLNAVAMALFYTLHGLVNNWAISNDGFKLTERFKSLWGIYHGALAAQNR